MSTLMRITSGLVRSLSARIISKLVYSTGWYDCHAGRHVQLGCDAAKLKRPLLSMLSTKVTTLSECNTDLLARETLLDAQRNVVTVLGCSVDIGAINGWRHDFQGGTWSLVPWTKVQRGMSEHGDIRLVWELGRMQHLPVLALAEAQESDHRSRGNLAMAHMRSWLDQNPAEMGPGWAMSLDVGLRTISWVLASSVLEDSGLLTDEDAHWLAHALWQHGAHINANLWYTERAVPNNHLVGEAIGLLFIGRVISCPEAGSWIQRARAILLNCAHSQFNSDGSSIEGSIAYGSFTLGLMILALLCEERSGFPLGPEYGDAIQKGLVALRSVTKPTGESPQYGDCDDGCAVKLSSAPLATSVLSIGAAVFKRSDLLPIGCAPATQDVSLLLGEPGSQWLTQQHPLQEVDEQSGAVCSRESGITVLRQPDNGFLICQTGIPGSHGHLAIGSFEWQLDRADIIVDPGTYSYNLGKPTRDAFRSSRAHNCLRVGDVQQCRPLSSFHWWPRVFNVETTSGTSNAGCWLTVSYCQIIGRAIVTIRRRILATSEGSVLVLDTTHGYSGPVELRYLLGPDMLAGATVSGDCHAVSITSKGGPTLKFSCCINTPRESSCLAIDDAKWSPRYGSIATVRSLHIKAQSEGQMAVLSTFSKGASTDGDLRQFLISCFRLTDAEKGMVQTLFEN